MNIPFNKPHLAGHETDYIMNAIESGVTRGNGAYTKKCHTFFEERYGFKKCLLTTSCTDALEMAAILCNIGPGDEVIVPSYTFVSTALAFVRQGATIRFADSETTTPNIDVAKIESLISSKTKVIVPVHYAGMACDMDAIMEIAQRHNLLVVEDAAQAVDSFYTGKDGRARPLGSIGHFGCFSFHETKNLIAGEGGMLVVNDERFIARAEIIWEKGTNRSQFFRGEIDKYGWVDTGSSFLPSDMVAAFLYAQLEKLDEIQDKRKSHWQAYWNALRPLADKGLFELPKIPAYATNNAHMFYLVFPSLEKRTAFIDGMKAQNVNPVFHYLSLHKSPYYTAQYSGEELTNSDRYTDCLVRLPLYYDLPVERVLDVIQNLMG